MLIRKEFKLSLVLACLIVGFESLVNTEGIQTDAQYTEHAEPFESLVNTEGIQTRV